MLSNASSNGDARQAIMKSIRSHLAESLPHDAREPVAHNEQSSPASVEPVFGSLVDLFKQNLEAVDGHCIIAHSQTEIAAALMPIVGGKRIAVSDAPILERLLDLTDVAITPSTKDLFGFDVGITTAQAGIAETGTLVLDSEFEQHRLVSLVPPVHVAIVDASRLYLTLGETLSVLQRGKELSPAITFVTGPSRTADIELTLTIGVHGPQELYVIVNEGPALT